MLERGGTEACLHVVRHRGTFMPLLLDALGALLNLSSEPSNQVHMHRRHISVCKSACLLVTRAQTCSLLATRAPSVLCATTTDTQHLFASHPLFTPSHHFASQSDHPHLHTQAHCTLSSHPPFSRHRLAGVARSQRPLAARRPRLRAALGAVGPPRRWHARQPRQEWRQQATDVPC